MNQAAQASVPVCPGCHFGCSLDAYRCGRGKGFAEKWKAGEPVPERGLPPMMRGGKGGQQGPGGSGAAGHGGPGGPRDHGGPGGKDDRPVIPTGARVMHALNIMANVLQNRHTESVERKVLASIARQGGFFAVDMLGKRTLVEQLQLDEVVVELVNEGFLEHADDSVAGPILRITEAGRARQAEWNAEHEAATADFLSPLAKEEQDQLARLLFRLIQPR